MQAKTKLYYLNKENSSIKFVFINFFLVFCSINFQWLFLHNELHTSKKQNNYERKPT